MKILLAASLSLMMAGASFAQEASSPGSNSSDPANYLAGPNIHQFYTDDTMGTMRSDDEVKSTYMAMSDEDRATLDSACEANTDPKHEALCLSLRTN